VRGDPCSLLYRQHSLSSHGGSSHRGDLLGGSPPRRTTLLPLGQCSVLLHDRHVFAHCPIDKLCDACVEQVRAAAWHSGEARRGVGRSDPRAQRPRARRRSRATSRSACRRGDGVDDAAALLRRDEELSRHRALRQSESQRPQSVGLAAEPAADVAVAAAFPRYTATASFQARAVVRSRARRGPTR